MISAAHSTKSQCLEAVIVSWMILMMVLLVLSAHCRGGGGHAAVILSAARRTSIRCVNGSPLTARLLCSSSSSSSSSASSPLLPKQDAMVSSWSPRRVAIVGGGLAGLSTAYHLLEHHQAFFQQQRKQHQQGTARGSTSHPSTGIPPLSITIFDTRPIGTGGASAVAGGFLHPLSPRGKLAYLGLEGLEATGRLVREAILHCSSDGGGGRSEGRPIVLRDEIYRVATSRQQAHVLQKTAEGSGDDARLSRLVEWIPSYGEYGALRLHSGCQVVHVPSYLKGLWRACQARCSSSSDADAAEDELNHRSARWVTVPSSDDGFREALLKQPYDAVVFAAGAGMFVESTEALTSPLLTTVGRLPVQLVRGQSLVMALPSSSDEVANTDLPLLRDAILCGKYVSPLPETGRVLVGATHEFKPTPWTVDTVFDELRSRTEGCLVPEVASSLWNRDRIRQVTQGVRVQSARGKHGRLPIVGRLDPPSGQILHPNAWVFTGLSSRGLLYHAWFGDVLARAILSDSEHVLRAEIADLLWWKSSSSDAS